MKITWGKKLTEDSPRRWRNSLTLDGEGELTLKKSKPNYSCIEILGIVHPFMLYVTYFNFYAFNNTFKSKLRATWHAIRYIWR